MSMYQLIVFDVDGTFYNLDDVVQDNYDIQVAFYAAEKGLSEEAVKQIFEENSILPYKSAKARSATEFFLRNGVSADIWREYRDAHTTPNSIRRETAVSSGLLAQYAELAKLALLSSNTAENIQKTLDWLGIDRGLFGDVFCSTTKLDGCPFSKTAMIGTILERYGVEPRAALSVGDRYATDIKPLVNLGGDGVLIHMPEELKDVYSDLSSGRLGKREDTRYKFFRN